MSAPAWKDSLAAFFSERADTIGATPTLQDLCYIAGRDPRIWSDQSTYQDLIVSIVNALQLTPASSVLEVGCASGFLAMGVSPKVGEYTGVDLSAPALAVARRLRLPNATFRSADGTRLPFPDRSFDAVFCYDVFTNFPRFEDGAGIITDMLRVVKPGGRVMVGSIPDQERHVEFTAQATAIAAGIEARFGPPLPPPVPRSPSLARRLQRLLSKPVEPTIVCYEFRRDDFVALGRASGAGVRIGEIHPLHPYVGYRFNAVYTRPE